MLIQTAKEISVCMLLYTIEQSKERERRGTVGERRAMKSVWVCE